MEEKSFSISLEDLDNYPDETGEQAYRRGYRDGYIVALQDAFSGREIPINLWDHWEIILLKWEKESWDNSDAGFDPPPDAKIIKRNKNLPSLSTRYDVLRRDNYCCQLCGRSARQDGVKLEIDHITPKSKGGTDTLDNLWTLCFDCNRGKSAKQL